MCVWMNVVALLLSKIPTPTIYEIPNTNGDSVRCFSLYKICQTLLIDKVAKHAIWLFYNISGLITRDFFQNDQSCIDKRFISQQLEGF